MSRRGPLGPLLYLFGPLPNPDGPLPCLGEMKRPRLFPCGEGGPLGPLPNPDGPLPYMFQGLLVGIKRLPPYPCGPARPLLGGGIAGLFGKYQFGLGGGP